MIDCLLTLTCSPEVEEKLLDRLLMSCPDRVFTSAPIACHSSHHLHLNPLDQVMGRIQAVRVDILLPPNAAEQLLMELRQEFKGVGLRFWQCPVQAQGEI